MFKVLLLSLYSTLICGKNYDLYPNNTTWMSTLMNLAAGDIVNIHQGTYNIGGSYFSISLLGASSQQIIIQGAPGENRPLITQSSGGSSQNILNIQTGSYFTLQGIQFTGGSRGLRLGSGNVSHALFQDLYIYKTTGTAFSANDNGIEYHNITIRGVEVYDTGVSTGECFYLGCVNDACRIRDSLIEMNYCHYTTQAEGGSQGSGIQVKPGSYNNIIRNNVCDQLGGPCVLVYDDYDRGPNIIDGNIVFSTYDNGFQATSGVTLVNNIVLSSNADGIRIQDNSKEPGKPFRNITIMHNTVIASKEACLRITNFSPTGNFLVSNNAFICDSSSRGAIYSDTAITSGTPFFNNAWYGGNLPAGIGSTGAFHVNSSILEFADAANFNLYPLPSSHLIKAGDPKYSISYDFNGNPRSTSSPTVGAYEFSTSTNPGWKVYSGFKNSENPFSSSAFKNCNVVSVIIMLMFIIIFY